MNTRNNLRWIARATNFYRRCSNCCSVLRTRSFIIQHNINVRCVETLNCQSTFFVTHRNKSEMAAVINVEPLATRNYFLCWEFFVDRRSTTPNFKRKIHSIIIEYALKIHLIVWLIFSSLSTKTSTRRLHKLRFGGGDFAATANATVDQFA